MKRKSKYLMLGSIFAAAVAFGTVSSFAQQPNSQSAPKLTGTMTAATAASGSQKDIQNDAAPLLPKVPQTATQSVSQQVPSPERISPEAIPAKIAFVNDHNLWLLDASSTGAKPKQVTKQGSVEIVGWSHDGSWLLYLQHSTRDAYQSPAALWAVNAEGTGAMQVEPAPIYSDVKWSPTEQKFTYFTLKENSNDLMLNVAQLETGKVVATQPQKERKINDVSWMPDGKSLLVSTPAGENQPIRISKMDLNGTIKESYQIGEKPNVKEGIYPYSANGMTISPNGRFVAYYLLLNSASLSADGVGIELLDLQNPAKPIELGGGLAYKDWFSWSADSSRLAFIEGGGREATVNKQLAVVNTANGYKITHLAEKGFVDLQPEWSPSPAGALYFAHGKENREWLAHYEPEKLMVPGQRIWQLTADEKTQQVTQGASVTVKESSDYEPSVSNDGKTLLFLRLDNAEHGSLYVKTDNKQAASKEIELLRNLTGTSGFYGNYSPAWFSVYWKK